MTDAKKMEKLAKWMGYPIVNWNPLANIADAWMLLEYYWDWTSVRVTRDSLRGKVYGRLDGILTLPSHKAARAISETVLEVI